jgi:hypothetical protein
MLEIIFWNGITDGQQFQSQKDEINIGQIRQVRREWDQSHVYGTQKLLHCVLVHYYCKSTSPGSATIMDILSGLTPSDVAKPPASNVEYFFGLEEQIPDHQCPQPSQSNIITNLLFMFNLNCFAFFSCIENGFFSTESIVSGL